MAKPGDAAAAGNGDVGTDDEQPSGRPLVFETNRVPHLVWAVIGLAGGALLLLKFGVIGKTIGFLLLALGLYRGARFVRTLLRPAGTIEFGDDEVSLPEGVCRGTSHKVPYSGVRHTFFLRRAVPLARTGPMLVIETEERSFLYPRDYFPTDAAQRRIAKELQQRAGHAPSSTPVPSTPDSLATDA